MKRAALQRRHALVHQLRAAVDQARQLGTVLHGLARNFVVVGLVGLAQVGGVGVRNRALVAHPVQRSAGVQPARKRDADFLPSGQVLEDGGHGGQSKKLLKTGTAKTQCEAAIVASADATSGSQPWLANRTL